MISGKDIVTLDMLTPERGVGIASVGGPGDELVATRDGGSTWRPTGNLPSAAHPTQTYEVSMAFTSPTTGWVQTTEPDITLFTASAGHSWLRLRTPGTPTSLALESDATAGVGPSDPPVWVTTDLCATPTEPTGLCRTELLAYGPGQTEPGTTYRIPSDPTGRAPRLSEANLLERGSADDGIVEEGSEGSPSRLLATSDAGRSWRTLADPCQGLIPAGLVMGARRSLILYCQLDGGMNQGSVRLYTSTTGGLAWTLTAEGNIEGPRLGNIGDLQASDLTVSGDRRRLWLLGAVVGVKSSADGGLRWNTAAIQTGGYDTRLVTAGADSAWLPLPGIALYRTRTGQSWTDISEHLGHLSPRWPTGSPGHAQPG